MDFSRDIVYGRLSARCKEIALQVILSLVRKGDKGFTLFLLSLERKIIGFCR